MSPAVPVTIITGALGSGKSTLLTYILTQNHGYHIAVIENEFADEIGIESLIVKNALGGKAVNGFYELSNGCMCCTVRDELVATVEKLMKQRDRFDYILIETSGLADPGPIAANFWTDEGSSIYLDGIITVVDAAHIEQQLIECCETERQLAYADVILLNKMDLTIKDENIKEKISIVNNTAVIIPTTHSLVDLNKILNIHTLSLIKPISADCENHVHDDHTRSIVITIDKPVNLTKFSSWIGSLLWDSPQYKILRGKGIITAIDNKKYIFQSVYEQFDIIPLNDEAVNPLNDEAVNPLNNEAYESRIILIGNNLDSKLLQQELNTINERSQV